MIFVTISCHKYNLEKYRKGELEEVHNQKINFHVNSEHYNDVLKNLKRHGN